MHPKLSKQPLKYVLAQVTFTSIEEMASYIPSLQNSIRNQFPHYEEVNIQAIQLREGEKPHPLVFTQWHFLDKEKRTGIILDKQSIIVHTNNYKEYRSFSESFSKVLSMFHEKLSFSLVTRLGLRYTNLIEDGINKINSSLQGFRLLGDEFPSKKFISKTETTQPTQAGTIRIQAVHIDNKAIINSVENIFVPPDLMDTAKLLSFKEFEKPQEAFLILDIDHFENKQEDFEVLTILDHINKFHEIIYQCFCKAVGEENLTHWA